MNKSIAASLTLLLTALIWGSAFVAQSVAMQSVQPFTFNAARLLVSAVTLLPCSLLLSKRNGVKKTNTGMGGRKLLTGGVICGAVLFAASSLQQIGLIDTSAGKAGFITALYIVLVPLAGIFRKKRVGALKWVAVALCTAGLYLLCVSGSFTLSGGDTYLLMCAGCFTVHILVIDHFANDVDCVKMSLIQFWVAGLLALICALCFEKPDMRALLGSWPLVLYTGVLSGAVGYTLQMIGQKNCDPTVASLIMSLESVFAVLAGWLILGDRLTSREAIGCGVMMLGIVLSQLRPLRPGAVRKEAHI